MALAGVIALGLALRWLLWNNLPRTGLISDEGEYLMAAHWLADGRGFAWYIDYLWTRAPLYPLFLAAHFRWFGDTLLPIYISQIALSLLNIILIFALARRLLPEQPPRMALLAALLSAFYLPYAIYTQVLLSETLFLTLLLSGFLALAWQPVRYAWLVVLLAGGLFGLATLTRSLTLAFLPLVALWLWRIVPQQRPRWLAPLLFLGAALLTISPWTLYNSRGFGGLIVIDTTGAYNLLLGARTAYDGGRQDAPTRNFALALLDPRLAPEQRQTILREQVGSNGACLLRHNDPRLLAVIDRPVGVVASPAERQTLLSAEGMCLITERPQAFVQKSFGELLDLFQINYTGDERFTDGFAVGQTPRWYAWLLLILDDTLYILALPLAVFGWVQTRKLVHGRGQATFSLLNLWLIYNLIAAPLLFAINRFRLPLLPFVFILAAVALVATRSTSPQRWFARLATALTALMLFSLAATPYAYLFPAENRVWSYFGPYPSSIANTQLALENRPQYEQTLAYKAALERADRQTAAALLEAGGLRLERNGRRRSVADTTVLQALALGLREQYAAGLALLPANEAVLAAEDVELAVVRADLLRSSGVLSEARRLLSPTFVDNVNPVTWAWDWLSPAPTRRIDLGSDLDLGYLRGCYLGEGDTSIAPPATFRWCSDQARFRFPQAATGQAQTLHMRVDGRGWQGFAVQPPPVTVFVNGMSIGSFAPNFAITDVRLPLPTLPKGTDLIIELRSSVFYPPALTYLSQQGRLVGQVPRLAVRIDWIEVLP